MENIIKIAAIAVSAALCAVVVRKQAPEFGLVLGLLAGAIILLASVPALKSIRDLIESLADTAQISAAVVTPVIKTVGISIITKLAAEICRDAKESGIAVFVETAGTAAALLLCVPLVEAFLAMIGELL